MLLEVSYGWSNQLCGLAFTVVSGASLIFTAFSSVLLHRQVVSESNVFMASSLVGLLGVLFLFDFGTGEPTRRNIKRSIKRYISVYINISFFHRSSWSSRGRWPGLWHGQRISEEQRVSFFSSRCRMASQRAGDQRRRCLAPPFHWSLALDLKLRCAQEDYRMPLP